MPQFHTNLTEMLLSYLYIFFQPLTTNGAYTPHSHF